jgi:hypothetical protein
VISVTTGLTVWTDGSRLWCVAHGQRRISPTADLEAASTSIPARSAPDRGSRLPRRERAVRFYAAPDDAAGERVVSRGSPNQRKSASCSAGTSASAGSPAVAAQAM